MPAHRPAAGPGEADLDGLPGDLVRPLDGDAVDGTPAGRVVTVRVVAVDLLRERVTVEP
ncbi:hypothetical protein [Kitasatospora camelliae]|uniref:Uncharacterized protein n=1 Tax=Kitasatospora camelliae TaxID=3156397 RepID=A0AAU8JUL1_9ACTN